MAKLTIVNRTGQETTVEGQTGHTVMEIIRKSGFDELQALCGGSCSCATCHVFVDEAFAEKLPKMSLDENDMLEIFEHRTPLSRLSCQIPLSDELDGLKVWIAAEA